MKKLIGYLIRTLIVLFCMDGRAQQGKITVRVTDFDTGLAINNAQVGVSFDTNIKPGWGWGSGRPNSYEGVTDTNGICVLEGEGNGGTAGVHAKKGSYYGSSGYSINFTNTTGAVRKKWQPWNPTVDVALKRRKKPIPLYAKWVQMQRMPEMGKPVGFDLVKGDWISPYGIGRNNDILITFSEGKKGNVETRYGKIKTYDYSLNVAFSNEGDGTVSFYRNPLDGGSELRLPRMAPEGAYEPQVHKRLYRGDDLKSHRSLREDQNYFIRIRTVLNKNGKVESALYGKIHGDFQFDHNGNFGFTYYLNPTPNDRNLEFDPKQNLFDNLPTSEQVRSP